MSSYPDAWAEPDLAGAIAAVTAGGGRVTDSSDRKTVRSIEFLLDGRACTLWERTPKRRGEWVALDFPWPAAWPDIALDEPGGPYSETYNDPNPPEGFALASMDLTAARAVVDAGFAAAAREPRAELSIDSFDGAMITSDPRVVLNAETARWLLGLLRLLLAVAPPLLPYDDVTARSLPGFEPASGVVQGTRAEVLHRLLTIRRHGVALGLDSDPDEVASIALVEALDRWITTAAALAAESRAGSADYVASRQAVRELARRIDGDLGRAEADGADSDLIDELRSSVAEVFAWDEPVAVKPTAPPATTKDKPGRWWRRRD